MAVPLSSVKEPHTVILLPMGTRVVAAYDLTQVTSLTEPMIVALDSETLGSGVDRQLVYDETGTRYQLYRSTTMVEVLAQPGDIVTAWMVAYKNATNP